MAVYKRKNGSPIELGCRIGGGGEGDIYEISSLPDLVAKIWANPDAPRARKMQVLLRHRPRISPRVREKIDMAWPTNALYGNDGAMVGYLMPKVSLDDYRELVNYAFPITRRPIEEQRGAEFSREDILDIARNLAGVFLRLHSDNYLIGDVNRANFLVDMNGRVFVIDIDSIQARDPDTGEVHRCAVGTPDFIPPELVGKTFRDFDRVENHDLFGLAVLIFELLMNGVHPYDPIDQTGSQGSGQMRLGNIKRGHSPYANLDTVQALSLLYNEDNPDPGLRQSRRATLLAEMGMDATADFDTLLHARVEPWLDLPLDLRNSFIRAFAGSGRDRPSAREWIEAIDRVLRDIRLQASAATTGTPLPSMPPRSAPPSTGGASASTGGRGLKRWLVLVGAIVAAGVFIPIANSVGTLITEDRYNPLWPWVPEPTAAPVVSPPVIPPTHTPVPTSTSMPATVQTLTPLPPNTPMPAAVVPAITPTPTRDPLLELMGLPPRGYTPIPTRTLIPTRTPTPRPLPTPIPRISEEVHVSIMEGGEPVEVSIDWNYGVYGDAIPSLIAGDSANLLFPLINHSPNIATITVQAKDDSHVGNGSAMIRITSQFENAMYLLILEVEDAGEPTATPTQTPIPPIHESGNVLVAEGGGITFAFDWNREVYGEGVASQPYESPVNIRFSDVSHSDHQATITVWADDDSLVGDGHAEVKISNAKGDMIYTLNVTVGDAGEATATPTATLTPTITPTVTPTLTPSITPTPTPVPFPNLSLEEFRICVERMACWPETPNEDSVSGSLRVRITWKVANIGSGPTQSPTDLRFYADGEYHEGEYLGYSFHIRTLDPGESVGEQNQTLERPDSTWPLDFSLTGDNTIIAIVDMQDRVHEIGDDCRNLKVYRDRFAARNSQCDNVAYIDSLPFFPTPIPTPTPAVTPTPTPDP